MGIISEAIIRIPLTHQGHGMSQGFLNTAHLKITRLFERCAWMGKKMLHAESHVFLGSGFKYFFCFTPIWGRFPIWLIFFKGVETTNLFVIPGVKGRCLCKSFRNWRFRNFKLYKLGETSNILLCSPLKTCGRWTQFEKIIIFQRGWWKSTSNQQTANFENAKLWSQTGSQIGFKTQGLKPKNHRWRHFWSTPWNLKPLTP